MHWTPVPFGKHEGKTLPEIIVRDADWFFWILPNLYGRLAEEAQEVARRARTIKPPRRDGKRLEVEYEFDIDRRFCGFEFVDAASRRPQTGRPYHAPGFPKALFWQAQTIDERAMRRVF
jgi:hypothetical protein